MNRQDPLCGMPGVIERHGHWFCSERCAGRFEEQQRSTAQPAPTATSVYTCPMHPEVVERKPGVCPTCGMALELRGPAQAREEMNLELAEMRRRFWVSLGLTLPILLLAMSGMIQGRPQRLAPLNQWLMWTQLTLATPVVFWAGWPFFQRGWASVRQRRFNMFTLIALGTGVAYGYSVVATIAPQVFPETYAGPHGVGVYFEAAATITTLVLLGQVLELRARSRTGDAIRALFQLMPRMARRILDNGTEEDVPVDHVQPGERLRVRPGERIATDGIVLEGSSAIDESMVTGESMPVDKMAGARVIGGTLNGAGSLIVRAQRVGRDTLLAHIVRMVAEAQRSRAPIQRLADVVSAYFVPLVIFAAAITFAVWAWRGPDPRLTHALVNAVAVLIIACPCALGLATPMSIMVGVGRGARAGVLIKDAKTLEVLEKIDTLIVDKTGTLTEGKPALVSIIPSQPGRETELLRLAGSLERGSEHPLATAIVAGAQAKGLVLSDAKAVRAVAGKGLIGTVEGRQVALGNRTLMEDLGIMTQGLAERADAIRQEGETVMFCAADGNAIGLLGVADPIKVSSPEAIAILHREGIRMIMMTGDHRITAEAVARRLRIDEVHAEVLPEQKAEFVKRLRAAGRVVAVAGDGVNDAPALAQADVGIAMGTGTDIAIESAGITLVKGDVRGIARARRLSRATMRNIRQNLFFAFVYNSLGVPIAAGALYPAFGWLLSPMIASAAMSFSSVSVIGNALRLRHAHL